MGVIKKLFRFFNPKQPVPHSSDITCFLIVAVTELCHALYTNSCLYCSDLGTCNCCEMAQSDFPELLKSIVCSLR